MSPAGLQNQGEDAAFLTHTKQMLQTLPQSPGTKFYLDFTLSLS